MITGLHHISMKKKMPVTKSSSNPMTSPSVPPLKCMPEWRSASVRSVSRSSFSMKKVEQQINYGCFSYPRSSNTF